MLKKFFFGGKKVQRVICVENANHGFHPTPYFNIRETGPKGKWELLQGLPGAHVPRLSLRAWPDRLELVPESGSGGSRQAGGSSGLTLQLTAAAPDTGRPL